jgi:hypothetical protein
MSMNISQPVLLSYPKIYLKSASPNTLCPSVLSQNLSQITCFRMNYVFPNVRKLANHGCQKISQSPHFSSSLTFSSIIDRSSSLRDLVTQSCQPSAICSYFVFAGDCVNIIRERKKARFSNHSKNELQSCYTRPQPLSQ